MSQKITQKNYDVIIVGGGCAGIAAAISAAKNGANTLLIEAGSFIGGDLTSGLPIDGAINARGEWVVGGVLEEILDEHERLGGYIGPIKDWRQIWKVCVDPEIMKIAIYNIVKRHGVNIWMYSFVDNILMDQDQVTGVFVNNKSRHTLVNAKVVIDCSGDGDVAMLAGAETMISNEAGEFQPISIVFRVMGVDTPALLQFCVDEPGNIAVGENEWMGANLTARECAEQLQAQGQPSVFFKGNGPLIQSGIADGELHETSLISTIPNSKERKEVSINTTRLANIDATDTEALSGAMNDLLDQSWNCIAFMKKRIPGFENAHFSGLAHRIGIRETRRIVGDYVLRLEDVHEGRKLEDGIGKGCHHIDIHQDGIKQVRIPIKNGGSYDMPYNMLVVKGLENVYVAGRCMSADRKAHASARVMGPCMAQGEAAGLGAALSMELDNVGEIRGVPVDKLRQGLIAQGAILEGTY